MVIILWFYFFGSGTSRMGKVEKHGGELELNFQLACISVFFIGSSIISLVVRYHSVSEIAPTIPENIFEVALTVFLTLSFLHAASVWFARHRHARQLSAVSLMQSLASSYFYATERFGLAPEVVSVSGQRVSLNRHIYWMVSISLLFVVGNSLQGRHGDLGSSRLPTQVAHIALMLVTGYIWQLNSNRIYQFVNVSLSMYAWCILLQSMRSNMLHACKKYKLNLELSGPFESIKRFALMNWIAFPLVNFLGFAGMLSPVNEEAGYMMADLFAKLISASIIQSGLIHVDHIKRAQAVSIAMSRHLGEAPSRSFEESRSFEPDCTSDGRSLLTRSLGYNSCDANCLVGRRARDYPRSKVTFSGIAMVKTFESQH